MIGHGCMIGPPAANGKGIQLIGRVPIIGERKADITDGLVNRWPLTANANDAVGALDLTNNGGVTFSAANGASFNGSNQYLMATGASRPTSFSLSVWVQPTSLANPVAFIVASDQAASDASVWGLMATLGTPATLSAWCANSSSYLTVANELNPTNYPSNKKTLITMTYNGTKIEVFRGGASIGFRNVAAGTGGSYLAIGRTGNYAARYFPGTMADARLYNRALTDDEILALAANGPNP